MSDRGLVNPAEVNSFNRLENDYAVSMSCKIDACTRRILHDEIMLSYEAKKDRLDRLKTAKLRLLASTDNISPQLLSIIFESD